MTWYSTANTSFGSDAGAPFFQMRRQSENS
jgi:hypothetical protein